MNERKTMRLSQTPVISRSPLTERVYLTTDYEVLDAETGLISARAKVDITDPLAKFQEREVASLDGGEGR